VTADPGREPRHDGEKVDRESRGGWVAPLFLLGVVLVTAIFRSDVMIGVPFIALVIFLPVERKRAILVAALFALLVAGLPEDSGFWWLERAWVAVAAGWFVALSLRWPDTSFLRRGLTAVAGSVGVFGFAFVARPAAWAAVDWRIGERIRLAIGYAAEAMGMVQGAPLPDGVRDAIAETTRTQVELFPAILSLGTLAALGLAWWMYGRWARGWSRPLGRLKDFRFSDHLVWLLIGGLALAILGFGEGWTRAGSNTVVFMGALYVLRGAGVILFVNGGMSALGAVVFAFAVLFLAPIVIATMLVVGVGDTWLDLRTRMRKTSS
jgi:hypothetical protein